jgi:hypothetical protein
MKEGERGEEEVDDQDCKRVWLALTGEQADCDDDNRREDIGRRSIENQPENGYENYDIEQVLREDQRDWFRKPQPGLAYEYFRLGRRFRITAIPSRARTMLLQRKAARAEAGIIDNISSFHCKNRLLKIAIFIFKFVHNYWPLSIIYYPVIEDNASIHIFYLLTYQHRLTQ